MDPASDEYHNRKQNMVLLRNTVQPGSSEDQIQVYGTGTQVNLNK